VRGFGLLREATTPCGQPVALSHAHALSVLLSRREVPGATRHKDLADALGLDKSSVARLCRRMEAAGHVRQTAAEGDGRARDVTLTTKGVRLAEAIEAASQERFRRVLRSIPHAERLRVLTALDSLNAAIASLEPGVDA